MKRKWGYFLIGLFAILAVIGGVTYHYLGKTDQANEPAIVAKIQQGVVPNKVYQQYRYPYQLSITNANAKVYSAPAGTRHAGVYGTVKSLKLPTRITGIQRADLNHRRSEGYIEFKQKGRSFWIYSHDVAFRNLNRLKGNNQQVEAAISAGMALVGRSKYKLGSGRTPQTYAAKRFDCSSFAWYCYRHAGIQLGALNSVTTYTLVTQGQSVPTSQLQRGDLILFSNRRQGPNNHIGIYLGEQLFLHDIGTDDTGGVGISSLRESDWHQTVNTTARRVV